MSNVDNCRVSKDCGIGNNHEHDQVKKERRKYADHLSKQYFCTRENVGNDISTLSWKCQHKFAFMD
jgi:hypothetical protein